ncbi:MAG TPA: hypothetical protein VKR32_18785 [Puia sp.]|nr:hypothetical protein [Puia sp.]
MRSLPLHVLTGLMQLGLHRFADIGVDRDIHAALEEASAVARSGEDIVDTVLAEPIIGDTGITHRPDKAEMEMRLAGHILVDAGDLAESVVFEFQALANYVPQAIPRGIRFIEIFSGCRLVDDQRVGFIQRRIRITGEHPDGEDLEKGGIGEDVMVFLDIIVALSNHDVPGVADPDKLFELRIVVDQGRSQRFWPICPQISCIVVKYVRVKAIDAIRVDIVAVIAQLVGDIHDDQETDCESGRQPDDVNGGKALAFPEAAEGGFEKVAEHGMIGFCDE